jgi:hypothetical protein
MIVAMLNDQRAFQRTFGTDELDADSRIASAKRFGN